MSVSLPASAGISRPGSTSIMLPAIALLALADLLYAPLSRADGQCKGEREHTVDEVEFMDRAHAAMESMFLPPPGGWVLELKRDATYKWRSVRETGQRPRYCLENKNDPIFASAGAKAIRVPTADEARTGRAEIDQLRAEIDALQKLPPDQQARYDELKTQATDARQAARRAEIDKNRELAKSKYEEETAKLREARLLQEGYHKSVQEQVNTLKKKQQAVASRIKPRSYTISVWVNQAPWATKSPDNIEFGSPSATANKNTTKVVRTSASFMGFDKNEEDAANGRNALKSMVDLARLKALTAAASLPSIDDSMALAEKNALLIAEASEKSRADMKLAEDEAKSEKQAKDADKRGRAAEAKRTDGKSGDKSGEQSAAAKPDKTTDKPNEKAPDPAQQAKDAVNKLRGLFGK